MYFWKVSLLSVSCAVEDLAVDREEDVMGCFRGWPHGHVGEKKDGPGGSHMTFLPFETSLPPFSSLTYISKMASLCQGHPQRIVSCPIPPPTFTAGSTCSISTAACNNMVGKGLGRQGTNSAIQTTMCNNLLSDKAFYLFYF